MAPLIRTLVAVTRGGPRAWFLLVRITGLAVLVEVGLHVLTLPTTARLAGARLAFGDTDAGSIDNGWDRLTPEERARCRLALRVLAHRPFKPTCLRHALLLGHLLRHRAPVLRVGVAKTSGEVLAHAWIEIDGAPLDDRTGAFRVLRPPVARTRAGAVPTTGAVAARSALP